MPPYSIGDRVQPRDSEHLWRLEPRSCRVLDLRPSRLVWNGHRRPIVHLQVEGFKSIVFQWATDFEPVPALRRHLEHDLDRLPEPIALDEEWRTERAFTELH